MGTGKDGKSVDCEERCLVRYCREGIRTMYSLIQFCCCFHSVLQKNKMIKMLFL